MDYFEVTFANGRNVIACDAVDLHIQNCLENTGGVFKKTTEEQANKINCYYRINDGIGWALLRMHALEAKIQHLESRK